MKKLKSVIALMLIFIFSISVSAQDFQIIPTTPVTPSPQNVLPQPVQTPVPVRPQTQQPSQTQPAQQLLPPQAPSMGKTSAFEEFISEKPVEITDFQLEILKKFEGITFQYSSKNLPKGFIAVAIKVLAITQQTDMGKVPGATPPGTTSPGATPPGTPSLQELQMLPAPILVDAGFLVGTPEAIAAAFKLIGIKVPFAASTLAVSKDVKQFGYDLFVQPPSSFAPVDQVPVGPDYVLGPGDELRISLWGRIEGQWSVVVDRDGKISLPKVGVLSVAGLSFKELKELLSKELSKYYIGFEMNVSMGMLRTIRVYVVGNAEKPGAYTISSLSTVINALFESGGPSKTGTMRDIQLKRNGQTAVHFDLYDFLLKGDKTNDARLMPEDVIFIPPIGPVTAIVGNVNSPAIYELKGEKKISQLIEMAGGLNTIAFSRRMQVERIRDNNLQVVFETDLSNVDDKDIPLQPGDVVKIFAIVPDKRIIRVSGAVQREGEYGFSPGFTVRDLIALAGGLKYYAYGKEAELTRIHVTDKGPETEKILFNLEKALSGEPVNNLLLRENDYLFIRTIPDWNLYQTVTISGEVNFPGTYTIRRGEKLSSLIERAGGFTDKAYLRGATFIRESVRELQQKQLAEMVDRLEKELLSASTAATSTALSADEAKIKAEELSQSRELVAKLRDVKASGRMTMRIDQPELLKKTLYDVELQEGDTLDIPINPQSVQVLGSVFNQTAFVYDKHKDYSDYIELAGGYTDYADEGNVYILKVDGTAMRPGGSFLSISWNKDLHRWDFGSKTLESGDTVVVPEKLERIAWVREIKDLAQILFQIAATTAVVIRVL
jgi:polysaccharide export outer membrane protein